jgi:hypothetical protein
MWGQVANLNGGAWWVAGGVWIKAIKVAIGETVAILVTIVEIDLREMAFGMREIAFDMRSRAFGMREIAFDMRL